MFVQIFASSAWTGVVLTIGAPNRLNSFGRAVGRRLADAADDARQRRDLLQESAGGDPLRRVGDEARPRRRAGRGASRCTPRRSRWCRARSSSAGSAHGRGGAAAAGRRPPPGPGCRSLSTCENEGVPIVITMSSARAASAARSLSSRRPEAHTRSSSSWVPASTNGIRRARIESSTALLWSMPSTVAPRSAKRQRERQADPAEADDGNGVFVAHVTVKRSDAPPVTVPGSCAVHATALPAASARQRVSGRARSRRGGRQGSR